MSETTPFDVVGRLVIQPDLTENEVDILKYKEEQAKYVKLEIFKTFLKEYNKQNTYTSKADFIDQWLTIMYMSDNINDNIVITKE